MLFMSVRKIRSKRKLQLASIHSDFCGPIPISGIIILLHRYIANFLRCCENMTKVAEKIF